MTFQIATFVAALLAAVVGCLNLQISARQKVAEYRLRWIEEFRDDIATLFSIMVSAATELEAAPKEARTDILRMTFYIGKIRLKLNDGEQRHDALSERLAEVINAGPEDYAYVVRTVEECSVLAREILKFEWERVKAETTNWQLPFNFTKVST